jgi:hypothetical protein
MLDANDFDAIQLPSSALFALDSHAFRAVVQPWHYFLRAVHILSAAAKPHLFRTEDHLDTVVRIHATWYSGLMSLLV